MFFLITILSLIQSIEIHSLNSSIQTNTGIINELNESNIEEGFIGPWIVYFYHSRDKSTYNALKTVAESFGNRLKVGEINMKRFPNAAKKYNITQETLILGIYDGIYEVLHYKPTEESIMHLGNALIEPSFISMDKNKFMEVESTSKDPFFVVLYSDPKLADYYFKNLSHIYKFRTKIYKSNDKALFDYLHAAPKDFSKDSYIPDREKIAFLVKKEGEVHRYLDDLEEHKISEWIFHSHFPHLTRISSENSFVTFHGYKPLMLLVTKGEDLVNTFEGAAKIHQRDKPFGEYVFGVLNIDDFPYFVENLIPGLKAPFLTIFNPIKQLFYHIHEKIDDKNFMIKMEKLISRFNEGKIEPYKQKKQRWIVWYGGLGFLALITGVLFTITQKKLKK